MEQTLRICFGRVSGIHTPHVYGAVKARRNQPRRTLKQAISRWVGHGISAIATRLFNLLR